MKAVLAKIATFKEPDRSMARRVHDLVTAAAPELAPRLWYGMPAYAKDGKVVCFFQAASKFKTRYATFGFQHDANLDDGGMWPTAFGLAALTADGDPRVRKAAIQTLGGYGVVNDFPVERIYRDVRVCQIYEGTSDVQKIIIQRAL